MSAIPLIKHSPTLYFYPKFKQGAWVVMARVKNHTTVYMKCSVGLLQARQNSKMLNDLFMQEGWGGCYEDPDIMSIYQ